MRLYELVDRHIPPFTTLNVFKSDTPVKAFKLVACFSAQHEDQLVIRLTLTEENVNKIEYWYPEKAYRLKFENPNVKVFVHNEKQNIYGFTLDLTPYRLYSLDLVNKSDTAHIAYYIALFTED
jgi:hypothetical protein